LSGFLSFTPEMKILILATAFSGMEQRVLMELKALNHILDEHYDLDKNRLIEQVDRFQPDVIGCPFLTQRIPSEVWKNYICLVVHPGIEGDRGPSSLDWAIGEDEQSWGVTLFQANEGFDAGDVWRTRCFHMREASKTSIYKREVTGVAVGLIKQALGDIEHGHFTARPLDYNCPVVKGRKRPLMRQSDRMIDWHDTTMEVAVRKLNAADSRPGTRDRIKGIDVHLFGAVAEPNLKGRPGDILAIHKGACCRATRDGAVWIKQLRCNDPEILAPIKLPASRVLEEIYRSEQLQPMQTPADKPVIEAIHVDRVEDIAYVYFDFYNGAMNADQCIELKDTIATVKDSDAKMMVLMGGEDFFSNGIHLNWIEASDDPALESWNNINAIDDLVLEVIDTPKQITISALRNNAGAGGVILALACDEVIVRRGIVLNPHYKTMGLFGSEYWTYLLPKRVGREKAHALTEDCMPMLAEEAVRLGLADRLLEEDWHGYHGQLIEYCRELMQDGDSDGYLSVKASDRARDHAEKPLAEYRSAELAIMQKIFFDPKSSYHAKRRAFVYKSTPRSSTAG